MEIILAKNLSKHCYILSGKKAFFLRYCDTGFKNKWTGFWSNGKKFLEYFAFKVNGKWLSPSNCKIFEHSEIDACHRFFFNGLNVKEFLFIPENSKTLISILSLENSLQTEKSINIELEVAINIREREENWHDRSYETKIEENKIIVNSSKGSVVFGSFPSGSLTLTQQYKDHYPGELQRCFIPGVYNMRLTITPNSEQNIFFIFSCGENEEEALANYLDVTYILSSYLEKESLYREILSNSKFEINEKEIEQLFKWSVVSLEKLAFNSNFGLAYFAGFPWYTQFWGRDLGWIIPALVDIGKFEEAKEAIKILSKFQSNGCIPNIIYPNGKVDYNSADATLLWIISLYHYFKNSADISFLNEMKESLIKALEWCRKNENEYGFIENGRTWMDTLERKNALEIQVFLVKALEYASKIFKFFGEFERSKELREKARKVERNLREKFWNKEENFFLDCLNDRTKTINSIFPLLFCTSENKKLLEKLESEEFSSQFGVRSISKNEEKYNPAGYHTGSAWGWLTALMACVEFKNKRPEKGFEYLKILFNELNLNCVSALAEAWNSEDNSLLLLKESKWEEGACLQGWSSALVIRCIDEFMLGIEIDALDRRIIVSPSLVEGMKVLRRRRISDDLVDLIFEMVGNKLNVSYVSKNRREYKLILAPNV